MAESAMVGAREAIRMSVRENRIVHIIGDAHAHAYLLEQSEGTADSDGETEYWGTTSQGDEWRVHAEVGSP
jgi:hypothetical protein